MKIYLAHAKASFASAVDGHVLALRERESTATCSTRSTSSKNKAPRRYRFMKIYMVASTAQSWMNGGYGHSLLAGEAPDLLVSFEDFSKRPEQQLQVTCMTFPYVPRIEPESKKP